MGASLTNATLAIGLGATRSTSASPRAGPRDPGGGVRPGGPGAGRPGPSAHGPPRAPQHRRLDPRPGHRGRSDRIIAEAVLSFLGLGVQPPTPSWGTISTPPASSRRRLDGLVAGPRHLRPRALVQPGGGGSGRARPPRLLSAKATLNTNTQPTTLISNHPPTYGTLPIVSVPSSSNPHIPPNHPPIPHVPLPHKLSNEGRCRSDHKHSRSSLILISPRPDSPSLSTLPSLPPPPKCLDAAASFPVAAGAEGLGDLGQARDGPAPPSVRHFIGGHARWRT